MVPDHPFCAATELPMNEIIGSDCRFVADAGNTALHMALSSVKQMLALAPSLLDCALCHGCAAELLLKLNDKGVMPVHAMFCHPSARSDAPFLGLWGRMMQQVPNALNVRSAAGYYPLHFAIQVFSRRMMHSQSTGAGDVA